MITPALTIGMAHDSDFEGLVSTIQALRIYHDCRQVEFLVVDNSPTSDHGQHCQDFLGKIDGHGNLGARYVAMHSPIGTSAPRNRVFEEARGEAVLCLDCHVILWPESIARLLDFYRQHPCCDDLLSGPIRWDNLVGGATHFADEWRCQMLGTWGQAWRCACSEIAGTRFSTRIYGIRMMKDNAALPADTTSQECVSYHELAMGARALRRCDNCGLEFPLDLPWAGHEAGLDRLGYIRLDEDPRLAWFPIPGQGLGLFSCRRDAWPGFPAECRGFGGEEICIHERFRQRSGRAICLPWLRWWHRFGHPAGRGRPAYTADKVRNYLIWHRVLGWDTEALYEHFVTGRQIDEEAYVRLEAQVAELAMCDE